jgi:hypothetical protein
LSRGGNAIRTRANNRNVTPCHFSLLFEMKFECSCNDLYGLEETLRKLWKLP